MADPDPLDLDAVVRRADPDRWLATRFIGDPAARAEVVALYAFNDELARVAPAVSNPLLGEIRLAWWRERLEELDGGAHAPAEPRLRAAAELLLPRGVRGRDLAALEAGWVRMFDPFPWDVGTSEAIWFRGRLLFALAAKLLGRTGDDIEEAGGLWALADAARHCSDSMSRTMLIGQGHAFARGLARLRFASALRPLSMLAAIAARDCQRGDPFEPEATPRRAAAMLRHRLTGRLAKPV